jgi:hypothetical protein
MSGYGVYQELGFSMQWMVANLAGACSHIKESEILACMSVRPMCLPLPSLVTLDEDDGQVLAAPTDLRLGRLY